MEEEREKGRKERKGRQEVRKDKGRRQDSWKSEK